MEMTMKRSVKMLVLFALCAAMMLAVVGFTAGDAYAQTPVDVDFLNADGSGDPSMADGAIAGNATYANGYLTIPLQVINRDGAAGYISSLTVTVGGTPIQATPTPVPYPSGGSVSIPIAQQYIVSGAEYPISFQILMVPSNQHVPANAIMKLTIPPTP